VKGSGSRHAEGVTKLVFKALVGQVRGRGAGSLGPRRAPDRRTTPARPAPPVRRSRRTTCWETWTSTCRSWTKARRARPAHPRSAAVDLDGHRRSRDLPTPTCRWTRPAHSAPRTAPPVPPAPPRRPPAPGPPGPDGRDSRAPLTAHRPQNTLVSNRDEGDDCGGTSRRRSSGRGPRDGPREIEDFDRPAPANVVSGRRADTVEPEPVLSRSVGSDEVEVRSTSRWPRAPPGSASTSSSS